MMMKVLRLLACLQLLAQGVLVAGEDGNYTSSSSSSSSSSTTTASSSSSSGNSNTNSVSYTGAYGTNFFADSQSTYYDGYQQSWRYLGWYVECGNPSDRYNENDSKSHDSDDGGYQGNVYCQRYLMWAAYIDPNYSGGGIGEYSFYDTSSGSWDTTACDSHGNGRCAPMDCHEHDTETWELMGVFKEATYFGNDAFFEQLFKHEGVCVWNDEDLYEFMSEARSGQWSVGCIQTAVSNDENTDYLYMDLKPTFNGNMTYALYTDYICKTEYDGVSVSVETVAQNMGMLYGKYLQQWNDALEIYKVCQPCRAYNLQSTSSSYSSGKYNYKSKYSSYSSSYSSNNNGYGSAYNNYNSGGSSSSSSSSANYNNGGGGYNSYKYYSSSNNNNNNGDDDGYDYDEDPNEGYFMCADDADYTNVNQCMKFRTHADLEVATWDDLAMATNQGGILQINVSGTIFGSDRISREQEQYWDQVRRNGVQKEKAKEAAQEAAQQAIQEQALKDARTQRGHSSMFMSAGIVTLACSLYSVFKTKGSGPDALKEPLYNDDGIYA